MLNVLMNTFSMELTNGTSIAADGIIADSVGDIIGNLLTEIAPVWNYIWDALSNILNVIFGF